MRIYVLSTALTQAPGKVGDDGKYLYDTVAVDVPQSGYDGNEEPEDTWTVKDTASGGGDVEEPENPIEPSMSKGEQAVFFENTAEWGGTMRCYAWNGATKYAGSWPGSKMTYLGNRIWKWTYKGMQKIPATAGVIFDNGASQTADLVWVNGGYYNATGYVRTIEGAGEIEEPDPVEPDSPFCIYYDNTATAWSRVNIYMWDELSELAGKWPGTQITETEEIDGKTLYKYSYTPTRALSKPMVIFNNGSSQTADLTLVPDGIYTSDGFTGQSGMGNVNVDAQISVSVCGGKLVIYSDSHAVVNAVRADGTATALDVRPGSNTYELPRGFYIVSRTKVIL